MCKFPLLHASEAIFLIPGLTTLARIAGALVMMFFQCLQTRGMMLIISCGVRKEKVMHKSSSGVAVGGWL